MNNRMRISQSGFTLVELMIAMVLGLIIVGGAIQVLMSTQQSYRLQENMSRLQENGRFAIDLIARDLRMAGFTHCGAMEGIDFHNNVKGENGAPDPLYDFNGVSALRATAHPLALPGTDAVYLRSMRQQKLRVVGFGAGSSAEIKVAGNALGLQQGDVVSATNCGYADTFRISNSPNQTDDASEHVTLAHAANVNIAPKLNESYEVGDLVLAPRVVTWFVGDSGRQHADGAPVTALYRDDGGGPAAVVDDVRDMRIRYGLDDNNDRAADRYERADDVSDWMRVVSARVSLLLTTSDNNLSPVREDLVIDNAGMQAVDRRIHRVFTTTVALRNHGGGAL